MIPIVPTGAVGGKGLSELVQTTIDLSARKNKPFLRLSYGEEIDSKINTLEKLLAADHWDYPPRWLALKLVEGDPDLLKLVQKTLLDLPAAQPLANALQELQAEQEKLTLAIVNKRYELITRLTKAVYPAPKSTQLPLATALTKY